MRLYPAIDLKDGNAVRLIKGDMDAATVYNSDPVSQARAFTELGFDYLHVVDLNGAVSGKAVNKSVVQDILKAVKVPVQLGGGIRTRADIEAWLEAGVTRVILGTAAVKNPSLVKEAAKAHPGKIVVGIDAKDGFVAVEGWMEASALSATNLAKLFQDAGVATIIYTDISRDGTLSGPNYKETEAVAHAVRIPIILSGGIGSIDDVKKALELQRHGVEGMILGRALYEKKLDAKEALALVRK